MNSAKRDDDDDYDDDDGGGGGDGIGDGLWALLAPFLSLSCFLFSFFCF